METERKRKRRHSRDHHGESASFTTHEVVGKHGDDYKSLFQAFINSDFTCDKLSVSQIIESIKAFALIKSIDTTCFEFDMNIRSITNLLLTASIAASLRLKQHEDKTWSILKRVEAISNHNVITSKKHMSTLRRQRDELSKLKVCVSLLNFVVMFRPQQFAGDRSRYLLGSLVRMRMSQQRRETAFVNFLYPTKWPS